MVSQTTARSAKKRTSPKPNASSDDEATTAKRRRSDGGDKENNGSVASVTPRPFDSPLADRNINARGKPAEAGVILKIYVENFMCHRKFTIDLCRSINFIHGQNGSGKSAILAAIQICLGAGARRTHRARNLKDLVRKDAQCNSAKIRVTVLNKGSDAYLHDIYGDSITIERTIAVRGGYNGFKLFDENMNEQSRSKRDLHDLLDKLNIQVENPVAILDQEEAKKFLTGKAEDKYDFFMKATELERLDRNYAATMDTVVELEKQSMKLNQNLETYMIQVQEAKKKWEQHQEIDKLKRKCEAHEEMLAWTIYQEARDLLQSKEDDRDKFREKAQKKMEELTQAEEAANSPDDEQKVKQDRVDDLINEAQDQSSRKHDLEVELKRAQEPQKALQRKLKNFKKETASAARNLEAAKQALEKKRQEIEERAGSAESEEAQRIQRLQEAESRLASAQEARSQLKQDVNDTRLAYEEMEPAVEQAKHESESAARQLKGVQGKIRDFQSSNSNSLAVFGQKCAEVKKLVGKEKRFRGPVVGPIGAFVKIVAGKEKFASIAEFALGNGTLGRFVVTNDHDRKLFQRIRQSAGCQQLDCGILQISPHGKYNIPGSPVDGVETVASVLHITNDLVFNCLVDHCKIEEKALSTSKAESEKHLLSKSTNGQYSIPKPIKQVYCLPQGDNWSVKGGMPSMISNEKNLKKTIGVDMSAALAEAKRDEQGLKEELEAKRREESKLEHEHVKIQKAWNAKKRELMKNEKDIDKVRSQIDQIKAEERSDANFDTDTSEFEAVVAEEQQVLEDLKAQESSVVEEIEEMKPQIETLRSQLSEVAARNDKVLADMTAAEEDLHRHVQNMSQRQDKLERKREKVKQYEEIIEKQNEEIQVLENDKSERLQLARRLKFQRMKSDEHERGDEGDEFDEMTSTQDPTEEDLEGVEVETVSKTQGYYVAKINKLKKKIEQETQRRNATQEDPIEAAQKYHRAKQLLDSKMEQIKEIEDTCGNLKADWKERKTRWRQFRKHIALKTDQSFDEILNLKGSSGGIEFDHSDKSLNLCVQKDSADQNSQQKDVKALSGGERSFTTIALLLALGDALETPFRVLDEFDVFLDPITRKLTIEALIRMAKQMKNRQFIFITPQDVSNVEAEPGVVKIHKMTPPARRVVAGAAVQQTLEFSQSQS